MPPAIIAAGIAAAGATTGAVLSSRASNKAGQRQQQAGREALEYEKQKDAQDRADQERDRALAKAAWDAQEARQAPRRAALASLLRARGINVPDPAPRPYDPSGAGMASGPSSGMASGGTDLAALYSMPYGAGDSGGTGISAPDPAATIAEFFRRRQLPGDATDGDGRY